MRNKIREKQIRTILKKILLEKCPEFPPLDRSKRSGNYFWCVGTPVFCDRISFEEAKELKSLCVGASPEDIIFQRWTPTYQSFDENGLNYYFVETLPQFIEELDKIIKEGEKLHGRVEEIDGDEILMTTAKEQQPDPRDKEISDLKERLSLFEKQLERLSLLVEQKNVLVAQIEITKK